MSSPSPAASEPPGHARLIAVCGAGAPTGHLTRATVEAARSEGLRTRVVDLAAVDPVDGPRDTPWDVLTEVAPRAAGAGRYPLAATAASADARVAAALAAVADALADPLTDLVVVDTGDQYVGRALLAHPAAIVAALEALLGPDLAMRSSDAPDADFPRLTAARDVAASQCGLLTGSHAVWRLVVASTGESVRAAQDALTALVLLGARVDGVVLDGYPRKQDPSGQRRQADAASEVLAQTAGTAVWRGGSGRRARPKGGPVTVSPGPVAELVPAEPTGDRVAWEWRIEMPDSMVSSVRVGVDGDQLVLATGATYRWLSLPAVLRRTIASEAVRGQAGLTVRFLPDPDTWPSAREDGEATT